MGVGAANHWLGLDIAAADAQHGFYAGAFGTPSNFVNAGWPWYNF